MSENTVRIPRAETPEGVGVSSRRIAAFMKDIEDGGVDLHTCMILRHGKVAAECYRSPYSADMPHQMYSVSKSITSTAIGLCVRDGLLSDEDFVADFFPDYAPKEGDTRWKKLKVKHLLSMSSGKKCNMLADKAKIDWIRDFIEAPWYNEPGAEFRYVNENMYMLCCIVRRVTGQTVREYLQPRLFAPLGIDFPEWETDRYGTEAGGWGIFLKTEDLAKIMLMYRQNGMFNGQRILDEDWVKKATGTVTDNSVNVGVDSCAGYGYCFWRCACPGAYRADGMFSQFGIVFTEEDAVVVVTSGVASEDRVRALIFRHFPAAFFDENKVHPNTVYPELKEYLQSRVFDAPYGASYGPWEKKLEGRTIRLRKNVFLNLIGFPVSMLPLAVVYMSTDKCGNINDIRFRFREHECAMTWTEGHETNTVVCGMDGYFRYGEMILGGIHYKVCCTAEWKETDSLYISVRPVQTIGKRMLSFRFHGSDRVVMRPSGEPDVRSIALNLAAGVPGMFKNPVVISAAQKALMLLPHIVEPKHRGKII